MNAMEDKLRDAYRTAAATVRPETIRDLAAGSTELDRTELDRLDRPTSDRPYSDPGARRPSRRRGRLATPLAAAAAATLIAAAAAAGTSIWHGRPASLGPAAAGSTGGLLTLGGAEPRTLAAVVQGKDGSTNLELISTTAGGFHAVAVLAPPRGLQFESVARLGNDRTFVVAAVSPSARNNYQPGEACDTRLYRLQLTAQNGLTRLEPLGVPQVAGSILLAGLAGSADGNTVAYATANCTTRHSTRLPTGQVGVIDLRSGTARTWSYRFPASPTTLSLSANGGLLGFVSNPSDGSHTTSMELNSAWVLRTDAAPGPLQRHYRRVLGPPARSTGQQLAAATVTPSGTAIYTAVEASPTPLHWKVTLRAYQTATGRPTGVTRVLRYHGGTFWANFDVSSSVSGRYLLLSPYHGAIYSVDLATGRSSMMPGTKGDVAFSVAW